MTVANPTERVIPVELWLKFTNGRTRTQRATLAVAGTYGATVRTLSGSYASDPVNVLETLRVTCDGGAVACPVSFDILAAPACEP